MNNLTTMSILIAVLAIVTVGVLLESLAVQRVGAALGARIALKQATKITLIKMGYAFALGHAVGFLLSQGLVWSAGGLALVGLVATPVLYKRFMSPSSSWKQAIWLSILAPIIYTVVLFTGLVTLLFVVVLVFKQFWVT